MRIFKFYSLRPLQIFVFFALIINGIAHARPINVSEESETISLFLQYDFAHSVKDYAHIQKLYHTKTDIIQNFKVDNFDKIITNALFVGDIANAVKLSHKTKDTSFIAKSVIAMNYLQQHQIQNAYDILATSEEKLAQAFIYLIAMYQKNTVALQKIAPKIPDTAPVLDALPVDKSIKVLNQIIAHVLINSYDNETPMLRLALHISPDNISIQYALLITYTQKNADYMVQKMLPYVSKSEKMDTVMAHIYQNTKNPAIKKEILTYITKNSPPWHMSIASDMLHTQQYGKAEKHLLQANANKVLNNDWIYWYKLGIVYERQKKIDKARKALKIAIQHSDNDPSVVNYLAYTELTHNINIKNNLKKLKTAYAQSPTAYIADSLGWAYYHIQDYENALYYLEKSSETMPTNGIINDHLGDVYFVQGRHHEALIHWKRALNDTDAKDIDRTLIAEKIKRLE